MKPAFKLFNQAIIIVSLYAILPVACSKKDSGAISKTLLLTSGSWILSAVVEDDDANGTYETDNYAGFDACYKDNYYSFMADGKLELNEGPAKCWPADPQTDMAFWQLGNNETTLTINSDTYSLEELNTTTLRIKEIFSGNRSAITTFTKK